MFAIISGLQLSSINRLKYTKERLPKKIQQVCIHAVTLVWVEGGKGIVDGLFFPSYFYLFLFNFFNLIFVISFFLFFYLFIVYLFYLFFRLLIPL